MRNWHQRRLLQIVVLAFATAGAVATRSADAPPLPVAAVERVGFTVGDMERALPFYTGVLPFTTISDTEVSGREYELLTGVFGARARIVRLQLGSEQIELTDYLAPKGRPIPADVRANDRIFQHIAIVVTDIDAAYRGLRRHGIAHASTAPQRLPDWNPNAGGIRAFYFRDGDGHFLELIQFPPGKGDARWLVPPKASAKTKAAGLFLGIDHTAVVVADTDASLRFYRDTLGLRIAGESENFDIEQEHLNNVFGARLRITALRAASGPGIELLEYLAPRDGRPAPADLRANDIAHWQTTLTVGGLEPLLPLARGHRLTLVSPGAVGNAPASLGFSRGALTRDPDGHAMRLVQR
jgi:catechol 2,3-dioxygenase-like lactoylglutathione lyase family enzyme